MVRTGLETFCLAFSHPLLDKRVKHSQHLVCMVAMHYRSNHSLNRVFSTAVRKTSETNQSDEYVYSVSEMQGWRICLSISPVVLFL